MPIENAKEDGYITLKEASEHFGYAPDYIGQLIRKGKIEGKQVYANVAWMTTKEAVEEYVQREKGKNKDTQHAPTRTSFVDALTTHMLSGSMSTVYRHTLQALVAVTAIFAVFSFYLLSVALDRYLVERANTNLLERTGANSEVTRVHPGSNSHISYDAR